jgi:small subunit ribosomal protein S3Ae
MPPKQVKGKKKGGKKKIQDAFLKKEWYVVKVPKFIEMKDSEFKYRVGYTPAKKGGAKKQLEGRTFTINLADLEEPPKIKKADQDRDRHRKPNRNDCKNFTFVAEETYGQQILTQWSGMEITRNYRCSLIRKWHTMIECFVDAKTTDGYVLRIKAVAFTRRQPEQVKKTCYAKNSQRKKIRGRMREVIRNHVSSEDLKGVIRKLSQSAIGREIKKSCQLIFPLKTCMVEKVKVLRGPKRDVARLLKIHELSSAFDPLPEEELQAIAAADQAAAEAAPEAGGDADGDAEVTES